MPNHEPAPDRLLPSVPDFTSEEHALGLELQREIPATVARVLTVGERLQVAYDGLCKPGRASSFGDFCDHYLPALDRKTLDRWRLAYVALGPLLVQKDGHMCPSSLENFRLTALYRLSQADVSEAERETALAIAGSGKLVDVKLVTALLGKQTAPKEKRYRKRIALLAGHVSLSLNHDDWEEALEEALRELRGGATD